MMLRRDAIKRLGGFEDTFRGLFEDQVFFAKVFLHERVLVSSRTWDKYRQHEAGACAVAYRTGEAHPVDSSPARGRFLEWLAGYLRRERPTDRALLEPVARCLRPYRFPTGPAEVVEVALATEGLEDGSLHGCHVDFPSAGQRTGGHEIAILGWALGRSSPVAAVEVVSDGQVVRRAPVDQPRPDLGAAFPEMPEAGRCGFRTSVSIAGMAELRLELRAALRDQSRVPLGVITAKRRWPARALALGAPLVSVVITASGGAAALRKTIERVLAQTYPHFEIAVVYHGATGVTAEARGCPPGVRVLDRRHEDVAGARAAGLAASGGECVIFLDAGELLVPDGLERAVEELTADPSCGWVGDIADNRASTPRIGGVLFQRVALARRQGRLPADSSMFEEVSGPARVARLLEARGRRRSAANGDRMPNREAAAILLFHHVGDPPTDPWALSVTPERFAEQLDLLRSEYLPLALPELVRSLVEERDVPERSVIVTFDDGYADNLAVAAPLLSRFGVPATFFLAAGYIGGDREFWWDELDRLLLQPGVLPDVLELNLAGTALRRQLDGWAEYPEQAWRAHRGWRAWTEPPTARHALYNELYSVLQPLSENERVEALTALQAWAGQPSAVRPSRRLLSKGEVVALNDTDGVEIGAHTVTHPRLSSLAPREQEREIVSSKQRLEEIVGHAVSSFSYPHGLASDYGTETLALVQHAGFACACTAHDGRPIARANLFELPRSRVEAWWDGSDLAAHLDLWFER